MQNRTDRRCKELAKPREKRQSFWSKIFKKPDTQIHYSLEDILSGITPIYSNGFGEDIYASDVVQQAIYSIVTELKKLDPVHIRKAAGASDLVSVSDDIQRVLDNPNPLMTTSDFIEKVAWTLLLNYNAFIYPLWEGNKLKGLYPLQPSLVEFDTNYGGWGETWVRFHFPNGYVGDVPYNDIIHLRYRFSVSEFMGGNKQGNPDFKPLLDTLKLNDTLLKGLAKSLNIQTSINGIVKIKTMQNKEEQIEKVKEFEEKLQANESGLLPLDISSEYIPIAKQVNLLDNKVLEFIDRKILRNWGVSIAIINGDYTPAQFEAFYQKALEPIVKSMSQAFTKGIFTNRETQGFNNKIVFYTKELIFMNTDQKINLFNILVDSASCYKNELRTNFGMRPLPELEGQLATSSNKENALNNKQDSGSEGETKPKEKEEIDDDGNGGADNG
jgi:HK97 family phage portal protein